MMKTIETERLRLRPFAREDVGAVHLLWTDPDVRKYLWDDEVIPRGQAEAAVERSVSLFETARHGLWAVHPRGSGEMIGFCGYWFFHDPPQLQLLYGLAPAHWGRGLATEAARAMIRYGFEELGFDSVIASADAPNAASLRVMEKAGMKFDRRVQIDGLDTVYYAISREDFLRDI